MRTLGPALVFAFLSVQAQAVELSLDPASPPRHVVLERYMTNQTALWSPVCAMSCQVHLALGVHYRLVSPELALAVATANEPPPVAPPLMLRVRYARHTYSSVALVGLGLGVAGTVTGTALLISTLETGSKSEADKALDAAGACSAASGVVVAAVSGYAIAHSHGAVASLEPESSP